MGNSGEWQHAVAVAPYEAGGLVASLSPPVRFCRYAARSWPRSASVRSRT